MQRRNIMARNKPTSSDQDIQKALADKAEVDALNETARKAIVFDEMGLSTEPLTPEAVEDSVDLIVDRACTLFFEPVQRVLADNGKAYPLTWDFEGREYSSEGEVVVRDRYDFLNRQCGRMICSGLAMILRNQDQAIEQRKKQIVNEIRFGRNAGTDVTAKVEAMADFLATMQEQRALIQIALDRAIQSLAAHTGEVFQTAEAREKAAAARKAKVTENGDLAKRLEKLGVDV
jgi:hypothetical protein